jgi:hypothetical protein
VIENAWQNTDIARKADSGMAMNGDELSIILLWNFAFLFWDHISSFNETCLVCLFVVLKSTDCLAFYSDKIF